MTIAARPAPDYTAEPQRESQFMNKRLRFAGMLIIIGGLVEGLTLMWNHPLSFLAFVGIGGLAIALGIAVYLLALVSPRQKG